eukprot:768757-Amphidinium_carterae.1
MAIIIIWLGPHPPTAAAQAKTIQDWVLARNASRAKERKKSWQNYVTEMWKQAPKRIYKWIRGTVVVWDLVITDSESAACKQDVKEWRQRCRGRREVPVGEGALDETFDLACKTEAKNASRQQQAGVFLDCSKCYER